MIGNDFLQSVGIFKGLDESQLSTVQSCCQEEQHKAGTKLFGEGEPASHLYIVKKGQIDLRFDLPGRPTSEKKYHLFNIGIQGLWLVCPCGSL